MQSGDGTRTGRPRVSAGLTVGIAIFVALVGIAAGIVALFMRQSWKDLSPGQATLLAAGGAIVVGCLALFGVWITRRGAEKNLDKQLAAERELLSDTQSREKVQDLRSRYTTVVEQLANDSPTIRVAGVYALASMADDWHSVGEERERQVCIDLLCAQLRDLDPDDATDAAVRSAIVKVIHQHTRPSDNELPENNWCRCKLDLRGANLSWVQLPLSVLFDAVLAECRLNNAVLMGVQLKHAHMRGADLSGAMLTGARLVGCDLSGARIDDRTELSKISYDAATKWPDGFTPPPSERNLTAGH